MIKRMQLCITTKPMANQNKLYFVIELTANPLGGLSEGRID
jgi:hypothetical protein